jgi:SEC-C motif-containing protein
MPSTSACACGSGQDFATCCGPLLDGGRLARTAEELMRSRYVAYTRHDVQYVIRTTLPDQQKKLDLESIRQWAEESKWLGLEIVGTSKGGEADDQGTVEFVARFEVGGQSHEHHELARFTKVQGRWYFDNKRSREAGDPIVAGPKVGRNDPCPCGSGKKHKKCCGAAS